MQILKDRRLLIFGSNFLKKKSTQARVIELIFMAIAIDAS